MIVVPSKGAAGQGWGLAAALWTEARVSGGMLVWPWRNTCLFLRDMTRCRKAAAAESGGRGRRYSWKLVASQRQMLRQSPLFPQT